MSETTLTEPASLNVVLQPAQNKLPCYDGIPNGKRTPCASDAAARETLRFCWADREL